MAVIGAVGSYFGARMAAAGHDVAFIARGTHLVAICRDGLRIESAHGDLHLKDVRRRPEAHEPFLQPFCLSAPKFVRGNSRQHKGITEIHLAVVLMSSL